NFYYCEYPDNLDRTWNNSLLSRLKRTIRRYVSAGVITAERKRRKSMSLRLAALLSGCVLAGAVKVAIGLAGIDGPTPQEAPARALTPPASTARRASITALPSRRG